MKTHLFYFKMNRENCFKTLNSTRYTQIRAQQKKKKKTGTTKIDLTPNTQNS